MLIGQLFSKIPFWFYEGVIGRVVDWLPESSAYFAESSIKKLKLFYALLRRYRLSPADPLAQTFNREERSRLLADRFETDQHFDFISKYELQREDPVTQMMLADQLIYLPEDILVKVDRMSMRHGLEVRSPFLDYRIVEFAAKLPLHYKLRGRKQKVLPRVCFADLLPDEVLARPKHGFAVPLASWFQDALRESFQTVVFENCRDAGLHCKEIIRLWREHQNGNRDHGFKLWTIFVYLLWWKNQFNA
jgi:asparagine synthase (glutamine-hydrolysing)